MAGFCFRGLRENAQVTQRTLEPYSDKDMEQQCSGLMVGWNYLVTAVRSWNYSESLRVAPALSTAGLFLGPKPLSDAYLSRSHLAHRAVDGSVGGHESSWGPSWQSGNQNPPSLASRATDTTRLATVAPSSYWMRRFQMDNATAAHVATLRASCQTQNS